jgi:hypothetical protein
MTLQNTIDIKVKKGASFVIMTKLSNTYYSSVNLLDLSIVQIDFNLYPPRRVNNIFGNLLNMVDDMNTCLY